MKVIKARPGEYLNIGRKGENRARQVQFDLSHWLRDYGEGKAELIYQRPGESAPYPVAVEREGGAVLWTVTSTDTACSGRTGKAELRYYVGQTLVKSEKFLVAVSDALGDPENVPDPPGQSWLEQALEAARRVEQAAGGIVPDCVREEADRVAAAILGLQNEDTFTFACVSDAHVNYGLPYAEQTRESATHAGMAIERVAAQVGLDFVANLGDNLWGVNTEVDHAKKENLILNQSIFDAFRAHLNFRLVGNHDANRWDACIPTAEIYAMNGRYNRFDNTGATRIRGYGYNDLEQYKLRVIALNTSDYIDNKGGYALSDEQKLWLMRSLDLSDKSDAAQWSILILSHFPLDFPSSDYNTHEDVPAILTAYQKGTAVTIDAGSYDYADKNAATIVANIHGHLHNFAVGTMEGNGITRVCTPNTCFYNNGASGTEADERYQPNEVYDKTANSAEDTTVTFYVVDLDHHVIHSVNYGAGYDREISYTAAAEAPFRKEVDDLAGAVRQAFYIKDSAIDVQSDNLKLILGSATDNGHGWATRESTTVYLIPVPAQANAVTVATTDSRWTKMGIALIQVNGGVYSSTNPGWLELGTYAFKPGAADFMAINLLAEENVPWGYDTKSSVTMVFS